MCRHHHVIPREIEYNIYTQILNTRESGKPQNGERWYAIGMQKKYEKIPFEFPKKIRCPKINKITQDDPTPNIKYPKRHTFQHSNFTKAT